MDGEIIQIPEYGKSSDAGADTPTVFVVQNEDGQKQRFEYTGFFPIKKGDRISIGGKFSKKKKARTCLTLEEKPLVYIPRTEDHLPKYLRDALVLTKPRGHSKGGGGRGKSYPKDIGEKLYQEMTQKLETHEKVLKYLDGGRVEFYVTVDDRELKRIYRWWNKSVLRRQLYLLGLYNKEIDESGMNPATLFEKLQENPTKVCSISMDRAFEINQLFRRETTQDDINCGGILRKLVEWKNRKGWFYVKESTIKELYPSLKKYKDYLSQEYDIIFDSGRMYTRENYNIEYSVASRIAELVKIDRLGDKIPVVGKKKKAHIYGKMDLTDEQTVALEGALRYQVCIITGGAGCGKTTLLREIVDNLENKSRKVLLSSFTGKAVMRIKEVICKGRSKDLRKRLEDQCITLSRLIHKRKTFQKTPEFDTLIIDEASMVPTGLLHSLFSHFPDPFKLILIGDCNQLEPIEKGCCFNELIDSRTLPGSSEQGKELIKTFRLTKNMRTGEGSVIVKNASRLVSKSRDFNKPFKFKEGEGLYILRGDIDVVKKIVKNLYKAEVDPDSITILCPVKKYLPYLTFCAQKYYLKGKDKFRFKDELYHHGDRMMQVSNFYSEDLEIMNGEEGYITKVVDDFVEITYSEDKVVTYRHEGSVKVDRSYHPVLDDGNPDQLTLDSITHSFAKTIHKSQGSEYENVIIFLPPENVRFVKINMLYTAITRAKTRVWIVTDQGVLDVITTQTPDKRYETLGEKLRDILEPPSSSSDEQEGDSCSEGEEESEED